jgi:hypothetical protein
LRKASGVFFLVSRRVSRRSGGAEEVEEEEEEHYFLNFDDEDAGWLRLRRRPQAKKMSRLRLEGFSASPLSCSIHPLSLSPCYVSLLWRRRSKLRIFAPGREATLSLCITRRCFIIKTPTRAAAGRHRRGALRTQTAPGALR